MGRIIVKRIDMIAMPVKINEFDNALLSLPNKASSDNLKHYHYQQYKREY